MLPIAAFVFTLAMPATAAPLIDSGAAAVQRGISGENVAYVRVNDGGTFEETSPRRWTQFEPNGRAYNQLAEVRRDASAVYLYDNNRRVEVVLDVRKREVTGTTPGSRQYRRFYSIVDMRAERGRNWRNDDRGRDWRDDDRGRDWRDDRGSRGGRNGVRTRQVEVGPIWDQADAEFKCKKKAREINGTWNGQWHTTVPGRMSECAIEDAQYDTSPNLNAIRDVDVGPARKSEADQKCNAAAARYSARWTGQWYSLGPTSFCQLRFR